MDVPDEPKLRALLAQFTLQEKIDMLSGSTRFYRGSVQMMAPFGYASKPWPAASNLRLGINGIKFVDGPRGIVLRGGTTFPVAIARGATFNTALEENIGEAIGKELIILGGNAFGGVCVNLLRHPAWGRAQETYGEDTFHLGEMGCSITRGVEKYGMAVVKHFALNSMENKRFRVNVKIEERTLHEVYLRHFKRIVNEADVSFVMSSYNQVNGEYAGQHAYLLGDVLKKQWGFRGAVMTDFVFGLRDAKKSVMAGQDLEMPFRQTLHASLPFLVADKEVPLERLDDACLRLIRVQSKPKLKVNEFDPEAHKRLALQVARESAVLLRNENAILPLKQGTKIALFGSLAGTSNLGDKGSSNTQPRTVVTCEDGIVEAFGSENVVVCKSSDLEEIKRTASVGEVCVAVVGYTFENEGEYVVPQLDKRETALFPTPSLWDLPYLLNLAFRALKDAVTGSSTSGFGVGGDRNSLELSEKDQTLIEALASVNENVIVVVMSGSAFVCERWKSKAKGLLCIWYPGEVGGTALGEILTGKVNPGGKLPITFPTTNEHLPFFDRDAEEIDYEFWHGYRLLDKDGHEPAFAFGFGLSYTSFRLNHPQAQSHVEIMHTDSFDASLSLSCSVVLTNVGEVPGDEVVQVYLSAMESQIKPRAVKELIAFRRISGLLSSESRLVEFLIPIERLAFFDTAKSKFSIEMCEYSLTFASSSRDHHAVCAKFRVIQKEQVV